MPFVLHVLAFHVWEENESEDSVFGLVSVVIAPESSWNWSYVENPIGSVPDVQYNVTVELCVLFWSIKEGAEGGSQSVTFTLAAWNEFAVPELLPEAFAFTALTIMVPPTGRLRFAMT